MPRLPEILDRNDLPEDVRAHYDYLGGTRGAVRLPFSVLLNAPELCYRLAHVGSYVRWESSLPDRVRELAICSAAREMDARYEWAAHARIASELGVDEATLDGIANRAPIDSFAPDDRLPIQAGRELLQDHGLADATFAEAQARFGDKGSLELIGTVAYYTALAIMINGMAIEPAPEARQLPK